ncbi:MAG: GreA/GreB family elongation factor [Patescibacteria group bacterium]
MAEEKKFYLTKEGLERIRKEYENLKELKLAKTRGEPPEILYSKDLNPEYLTFREDLNFLGSKIIEFENIIKNAELIKPPEKEKQNSIDLGATVLVEIDGEIDEFRLVGTLEADPSNRKISNESPIGQALLGKRVGETVVIKTPIVNHACKITKIKYNNIDKP